MFIKTISNSKGDVWDQCKLKYKYRYVDRLPEPPEADTKALEFGKYIHKVLEDGYKATTLDELLEIAKRVKPTYKVSEDYNGKDVTCFRNFLKFNANLNNTIATEGVYEAKLNEELTTNGVIDRVEQGDAGGLLVIDYKTSKREKSRIELYQDDQLKGYVHACSQQYNVPVDKIFAGHYYPLTNNFVYVKYSKVQIAAFVKSRINKIWEIRKAKKEDLRPSRNQFCNWCSYQSVCPEFNSNQLCEERIQALKDSKKDQE